MAFRTAGSAETCLTRIAVKCSLDGWRNCLGTHSSLEPPMGRKNQKTLTSLFINMIAGLIGLVFGKKKTAS